MKMIIFGAVAALTFTGTASAQQPVPAPTGDISRAAAIADAERRFAQLDTNRNGTLEREEMRKAFEQRRAGRGDGARQGGPDRRRPDGPRAGGPRNAGPVTLDQFRARAEQRFDRLDLDRNGVITAAEREQLRAQRSARSRGSEER